MIISFTPRHRRGVKEGISTIAVSFEKHLIFITFPGHRPGKSTRTNLLLRTVLNRNSYILRHDRILMQSHFLSDAFF
ncbi:MAG: hypothetical protein LBR79_04950 [Oscillospiraceae bacterium]|nr:hypothetical protein [Oscillospiraceae bacterium]